MSWKWDRSTLHSLLPFAAIAATRMVEVSVRSYHAGPNLFPFGFLYLLAMLWAAWRDGLVAGLLAVLFTMVGTPLLLVSGFQLQQVDLRVAAALIATLGLVGYVAGAQRRNRAILEEAVQARTAEFQRAVASLQAEVREHRETAQALRESEARVDFTLEAAGIGRWDLDLATGQVARSRNHDLIFGYDEPLPEWTRDTFLSHVPPEDRPVVEKNQSWAETQDSFQTETRIIRRDGKVRWVAVQGKVLRDATGKAVSMLGSVEDITPRKESADRLRTQLRRLRLLDDITRGIGERHDLHSILQVVVRTLTDSMPVDFAGLLLPDERGAFFGLASASGAGDPSWGFDEQSGGLAGCLAAGQMNVPDLESLTTPLAAKLTAAGMRAAVASPLQAAGENLAVLVVARRQPASFASDDCEFLRQLSDHVALAAHQAQIRAALQQAYDDLRVSQQAAMQQARLSALGQMASGIAHDINNAVSPVSLYTAWLLENEPALSLRGRQYLETSLRAIEDVAETVARLREFCRPQEPARELEPVRLDEVARHVLELTQAHWGDMAQLRGVTIHVVTQFETGLPAVPGIESEIREALTNLVLNAADAMPTGGVLTIRVRRAHEAAAGAVIVEVSDTGIGMDETTRRLCLEPFYSTKGERGTGLGLAMVYGTARRHEAAIEIESAPGLGTTARLSFPMESPNRPPKPGTAGALGKGQPAPEAPTPPLRVLVIDDDPLLILSLRDLLSADGHDVTTAGAGQDGVERFRASVADGERFSVVITDLGMPVMDGRAVARAIKTASPQTPVILLTGWGQQLAAEGDGPAYVDRVLSKPPKLSALRAALRELTPLSPPADPSAPPSAPVAPPGA